MPEISGIDALRQIVRATSAWELQQHSRAPTVENVDGAPLAGPVYGHWMGIILLANAQMRLTFKTFYSTVSAKRLTASKIHQPVVAEPLAHDFMREYLNLTGGAIKRLLEAAAINVGISLPLVTRGLDEIYANVSSKCQVGDLWSLKAASGDVVCRTSIESFDNEALAALHFTPGAPPAEAEDLMEFL